MKFSTFFILFSINLCFFNFSFSNNIQEKVLEIILQKNASSESEKKQFNSEMKSLLKSELKKHLKNNNDKQSFWFKKKYILGIVPLALLGLNGDLFKGLFGYKKRIEEYNESAIKVETNVEKLSEKQCSSDEVVNENIEITEMGKDETGKEMVTRRIRISRKISKLDTSHSLDSQKENQKESEEIKSIYIEEEKRGNGFIIGIVVGVLVVPVLIVVKMLFWPSTSPSKKE